MGVAAQSATDKAGLVVGGMLSLGRRQIVSQDLRFKWAHLSLAVVVSPRLRRPPPSPTRIRHGGGQTQCPGSPRRSRSHVGSAGRGPNPHPDPPVALAVAPLAALPRHPRPVPAGGPGLHHTVPALPLPRRLAPPLGARLRLPPARGAPLPPALVLALPVPLPAPAAARALRGHRAGPRAVDRRRTHGVRAPAAGEEGPADGAAADVRGGRGAHHRAQRRDRRRRDKGALLGPAQPHLRRSRDATVDMANWWFRLGAYCCSGKRFW